MPKVFAGRKPKIFAGRKPMVSVGLVQQQTFLFFFEAEARRQDLASTRYLLNKGIKAGWESATQEEERLKGAEVGDAQTKLSGGAAATGRY